MDIAPNRKIDPGVMFPWGKLYNDYGIGAWLDDDEMNETIVVEKYKPMIPCPRTIDRKIFLKYLNTYGYNVRNEVKAILAFKAHFTTNQNPKFYNTHITLRDMY